MKKKKKLKEKKAAAKAAAQAAGNRLSERERAMEARYVAQEKAATREYEKLSRNVAELQSQLQLQVAAATAASASVMWGRHGVMLETTSATGTKGVMQLSTN